MTRLRAYWPIVLVCSVAAVVCVDQLSQAHALFGIDEYDDGVYFGGAVRLVHGVLPYRDFAFAHPPGILIILAPFAALADWTGTRWFVAEGRVLTAVVAVANVFLISWVVRRRGVIASLVAGLALAVYPMAVTADKTVLLEPYLVLFVLLGVAFLFDGDEVRVQAGWLVAAGACFGFAGAIKLWAVFPAVAAVACCLPKVRQRLIPFIAGAVAAFAIPVAAFGSVAPVRFVRDVVTGQFERTLSSGPSTATRLIYITGLRGLPVLSATADAAIVLAIIYVAIILVGFATPGRLTPLEVFALLSTTLTVAALLTPSDFFQHYGYFTAPFAALALALAMSRLFDLIPRSSTALIIAATAVVIAGLLGAEQGWRFIRIDPLYVTHGDPGRAIEREIPKGACVVTDQPALTLIANRFTSSTPGCPKVVDPFYVWLLADPKQPPPSSSVPVALTARWSRWLASADYVVFSPQESNVPFTNQMLAAFHRDFRELPSNGGAYVYKRVIGVAG